MSLLLILGIIFALGVAGALLGCDSRPGAADGQRLNI